MVMMIAGRAIASLCGLDPTFGRLEHCCFTVAKIR